ncbi:MAG: hypothetical protein R8G01_18140 [Ilumatobacteraceae bacterium]|nr:hypothetical protein [Ilumatobacteraceae bacterium]
MSDPTEPPPGTPERFAAPFGRRALLRGAFATGLASLAAACTRSEQLTSSTAGPRPSTPPPTSSTTAPRSSPPPGSTVASTTSTTSSTSTTTTSEPATSEPTTSEPPDTTEPTEPTDPSLPPGAYDPEALYVALYGHPGSTRLGVLGEQDAVAGATRAALVAAAYDGFGRRVVPTFEIIASVAGADSGSDGDFSNEFSFEKFEPHLDAAAANDMHVVFDLQSGRSRFPDQAREYEALWLQPHASIALDPEWRVGPDQQPGGGRIGTVDATEVNETIDYIDGLITANGLPPKMCIVHQFAESMITDKQRIRGTENVQVVIHMDGFGTLELKRGTWGRVVSTLPEGAFTGWKNFYDEDQPTPTPAETMANEPAPRFVSYQ